MPNMCKLKWADYICNRGFKFWIPNDRILKYRHRGSFENLISGFNQLSEASSWWNGYLLGRLVRPSGHLCFIALYLNTAGSYWIYKWLISLRIQIALSITTDLIHFDPFRHQPIVTWATLTSRSIYVIHGISAQCSLPTACHTESGVLGTYPVTLTV
jgi:hypothetical protein